METEGRINRKVFCLRCNIETNNSYVAKYCDKGFNNETGISYEDNFYITKCLGCDTIAFYEEYGDSEMVEYNEFDEKVYYTHEYRYPNKPSITIEGTSLLRESKAFEAVPDEINDLYLEVVASYNTRHYLLSAVGLRMIVEGLCKELEVKEGVIYDTNGNEKFDKDNNKILRNNLEGKINGLQTIKLDYLEIYQHMS